MGYEIRIEAFAAHRFAQIFFDAFATNQEPDVISFDNYGILRGITTQLGAFTGIESSPVVQKSLVLVTGSFKALEGGLGGWQFLVSTSRNYEAARSVALASSECDRVLPSTTIPAEIQSVSQSIAGAFLQQARSLRAREDSKRLVAAGFRRGPVRVSETKACGFWGNENLAFVSLVSTYESATAVGQIPLLLVLRRQGSRWRLLVASADPISNNSFLKAIPGFAGLLHTPGDERNEPQSAELLSPEDGQAPLPEPGQRFGTFRWAPSSSEDVVAEVVEFAYQDDARLFLKLRSKQHTNEQISAGSLWNSHSEWDWRVWSITNAGVIAFSRTRSFPH